MTIQKIENYLEKPFFLVFPYHSEYYSLMRSHSPFGLRYSLVTTDAAPQQRNSLELLCTQASLDNVILLADAIRDIEIPDWSDPSWTSYEAVRHTAIIYGSEVHFLYHGIGYWISHGNDGAAYLSDNLGNTQCFRSCRDLFENARVEGSTLADIWKNVSVDAC